jgi:small neutral amino acid transporter SnatA (MarC family)
MWILVWSILTVSDAISTYLDFTHGNISSGVNDVILLVMAAAFLGFELRERVKD